MALEIKIGGTSYRGTTNYSIKQQGGAVSTTSLNVLLGSNPIPLVLQVAQVYLDGTLFFSGLIQSVSTPEYSSTYETKVFSIDVSSLECLMNHRLVTKNFYYYTYTSWTQVIQYLFDNYISQEGITLGSISTTSTTFDSKYAVADKKLYDVLNDIADSIGNASWWISADRKFYFKISTDFTEVVPPTHLTKLKLSEKIGDIRTVEKMTGASSGITATQTNDTLLATIAARTGGSGKIEIAETDSDIHSDSKAATTANKKLLEYAESEKTITCICHDLSKSEIYNSWPLDLTINGVAISGDYVVTDRTIEDRGPDAFSISVTLKNNNYFSRYGYSLKKVATIANDTASNLSDIAADNKLTASEKKDELARWNDALAAKSTLDAEADEYGVSRVAYDAAFVSLSTYLNAGAAWTSGTPAWFAGDAFTETTDIVGADYDGYWQSLADAKLALEVALRAAIQSSADDASAAAHEASIKMTASASSLTRSRAGALLPSTISLAAKYGDDNTVYAGRFQIELSTDGSTFAVVYQSAADESSHVYTAVPTYLGAYVVLIRIRLYKAGGFATIFEEVTVGVSADTSSAPLYWGALTVAPVSNIQIDDYYFDNNVPASGGGVIRYYTGSSWAQATSAWHLWANAWKTAIADATKWATDNNATLSDVTAFMNAIIGNLVVKNGIIDYLATSTQVSTALCDDGTTRRMEIDWDNAVLTARSADQTHQIKLFDAIQRTIEGAYALDHEGQSLVFRLASTLAELARIKYDPTSGLIRAGLDSGVPSSGLAVPVKFAGEWTMGTWGAYSVIESVNSSYPSLAILPDGRVICVYQDLNTRYLRQKIRDTDGTWGAYSVIESVNSSYPSLAILPDGRVICVYRDLNNYLRQKIRATDGTWGAYSVIESVSSYYSSLAILPDGRVICVYQDLNTGYLRQKIRETDGTWGAYSVIESVNSREPSLAVLPDGRVLCVYIDYSTFYLRQKIRATDGTWGAYSVIESASSIYPSLAVLPDGRVLCVYIDYSTFYLRQKIRETDGTWGAYSVIESVNSREPSLAVLPDGRVLCVYRDQSTGYLRQKLDTSYYSSVPIKTAFAPVGMGICELGKNSNGYYFKIKTGTGTGILVCWKQDVVTMGGWAGPSNGFYYNPELWTMPARFSGNGTSNCYVAGASFRLAGYVIPAAGDLIASTDSVAYFYRVSNNADPPAGSLYRAFWAIGFYSE